MDAPARHEVAGTMKARFVYVIGTEPGPFKIGYATSLRDRLGSIQTGSHQKMQILYHAEMPYDDAPKVEQSTHKILASYRLSGEWFNVSLVDAKAAVDYAAGICRDERVEKARVLDAELAVARVKKAASEKETERKAEAKAEAARNVYVAGAEFVRRVTIDEYFAENDRIKHERSAPNRAFVERMKNGKKKKAEKLAKDMADAQAWLDAANQKKRARA